MNAGERACTQPTAPPTQLESVRPLRLMVPEYAMLGYDP